MRNHYEVLGLKNSASDEEIKKAYRQQAFIHHPDKNSGNTAKEQMQAINEANYVLSDPERRQAYDNILSNLEQRQTYNQANAKGPKQPPHTPSSEQKSTHTLRKKNPKLEANLTRIFAEMFKLESGYQFMLDGKLLNINASNQAAAPMPAPMPAPIPRNNNPSTTLTTRLDLQLRELNLNNNPISVHEVIIQSPSSDVTTFQFSANEKGEVVSVKSPDEHPLDVESTDEWSSAKISAFAYTYNAFGSDNDYELPNDTISKITLANAEGLLKSIEKTDAIQNCGVDERKNELSRRADKFFAEVAITDKQGNKVECKNGKFQPVTPASTAEIEATPTPAQAQAQAQTLTPAPTPSPAPKQQQTGPPWVTPNHRDAAAAAAASAALAATKPATTTSNKAPAAAA